MNKSQLLGAVCAAVFSFISMSSHAALIDNGGGLIYDDVLEITWAQPRTSSDTWDGANTWAAGLTLGGATEWRLPYISVAAGAGFFTDPPINCSTATEFACRDNELGYMFYHNLSGTSGNSILTSVDSDLALFPTLQSDGYWSGTQVDLGNVWGFNFDDGAQNIVNKGISLLSWAVHSGNVSAVPVPAAVWLFGSGLLGLIGVARHKKA